MRRRKDYVNKKFRRGPTHPRVAHSCLSTLDCTHTHACLHQSVKTAPNKDKCNIHFSSAQVKKTEIVSKQFISYTEQQGFNILCGHRQLRLGLQHDVTLTPRLHVWGNCVRTQRVPRQVQCLHQLVSILAAMWNYSLLEKSPHILVWIHVRRAGRLKQDVGYSAIEKILLCLSEGNERNFELFLACNTCTPNFYTRCVQLSSYTQIASDVMGAGFAAPALHFGPDFTERNCTCSSTSLSLREFAEKTLENLRKKLRQKTTKNATKSAE